MVFFGACPGLAMPPHAVGLGVTDMGTGIHAPGPVFAARGHLGSDSIGAASGCKWGSRDPKTSSPHFLLEIFMAGGRIPLPPRHHLKGPARDLGLAPSLPCGSWSLHRQTHSPAEAQVQPDRPREGATWSGSQGSPVRSRIGINTRQ